MIKLRNTMKLITMSKKLLISTNIFFVKDKIRFVSTNCLRYNCFLVSSKDKNLHNFPKHYHQGGSLPLENSPVSISRSEGLDLQYFFQRTPDILHFF